MSKSSKELKVKKLEELEKLKNELKLLNEEAAPEIKEAFESVIREDSDDEVEKPKPTQKQPRTDKQQEQFKKALEAKSLKAKQRKEEKAKQDEADKKALEDKLVKKAIIVKKKQIKKQAVLDEISDEDEPIEKVIEKKKKGGGGQPPAPPALASKYVFF